MATGGFQFQTGDVVLVEWIDKLFYAKILHIDHSKRMCTLLFDDDSIEHCPFTKIHSVTETTAEIVCIVCKDGASTRPNEIVLCDKCGVGYHQKCHSPSIEDTALEPEEPWMCIYCTNGSECPYLLNPFETKLQKDLNSMSVRQNREDSKDNQYIPNHVTGFIPNKPSRVRNLMANYYHDTYQRRSTMDTSHVRHVPREAHHMMNRRVMMERPRNKYYKYPDEGHRAERENLDSRKRRLESQEKQKTSQDVWDNGGHTPTSCDVSVNDVIADDVSKLKGKEGPREKQRLTQDLERQRKKLKEDMKRGQQLQREHNQLLTRDQTHDQSRDITNTSCDHTSEDVPTDGRSDDDLKYDRRQYSHNGTSEYSENIRKSLENIRKSSENRVRGDYMSADVRVNGAGSGDETLKGTLDPCDCAVSTQGSGVNTHIHRMSDIQCEHSREHYQEVNGHGDDAQVNHEHARNTRGVHEHARENHVNSEGTTKERYSSEKIEVIGESSDLSDYDRNEIKTSEKHKHRKSIEEKNAYDEYLSVRKEKRIKEGNKERSGSVKTDKGSLKDSSSGIKRTSCSDESIDNEYGGNKRNKTVNQDGGKKHDYESDATQNRVRSDLPRHNWLVERWINQKNTPGDENAMKDEGNTEGLKDTVKDTIESTSINNTLDYNSAISASPVFEQTYKDEVIDEGYTKRISDDEKDNEIIQHEILKVPSPVKYENDPLVNHSPGIKYSQTKQELSPRSLNNCSPEIKQFSPKVGASPKLAQSSPNLVETSPNFIETSSNRVQISPNRIHATNSSVPVSPNRLQATSCGTTLSYQVQTSSNQIETSPNRVPTSPKHLPNRLPSTPNCITTSPNQISSNRIPESQRVPASPQRVSSNTSIPPPSPNHVPHSPNDRVPSSLLDGIVPSPNRIPAESPTRIPVSPQRVPTHIPPSSPNKVPQSPNRISDRVAPSPNRIPVSPNEKTTKRASPIASGQSIETRQISPRYTPRTEQDLGGNQGELRTQDRAGSREDRKGHNEYIHQGELRRLSGTKEDKIIEVTSDSEENKRTEENKEVSRIQTGKSVNPVSPIVRSDKHVMEEIYPAIHEPRTQDIKPLRVPAELPPGIPFMGSAYVAGYSPKTFTPHLITHNAAGMRHPGHPVLQGGLPGRLEFPQHTRPDSNCPFHGKKTDKMHPHVPGYPVLPADAHIYPQHPIHDKLRDKRSEHLDLHSDPRTMQRRLSAVYDRHLVMPHGIPIHHPRYLTPGFIDEHGFPIDNEIYKHRLEAAHPYTSIHKPQSHTPGGITADTSRYVGSPSEEKRHALKYMEDKRDTSKEIGMQSDSYRHHHCEQSPMTSRPDRSDVTKRFNISPQDTRSSRADHVPRTCPESPEKYSPSIRHPKEAHQRYIQLGEGKKTGPSPSPGTLDRESISRDFNERINMLDKSFKEKLEGTDRSIKEEAIAAYSGAHRRNEFDVGGPPRAWSENQVRGVEPHQPRGVDPLKYRHLEKQSPNTKHSPSDEQRKLQDSASPRGLVTSVHTSTHKPTVPMPSYRFHGNLVPSSPHGFGRGMVGVPVMANHGDFGVWQSIRGPTRIPGYPPNSSAMKETQGVSAEKNERLKPEYMVTKKEHQETERSLAFEKHRMNLAQLENERRKAFMAGKTERIDESSEHERPRTREEELRRNWELENRKRKLEQPEVQLSPHARAPVDMNKRITDKPHHIPDELALRKEQYLAMYARQHEGYGVPGVPYPDRARGAGNPPFYMGRMGGQAEASVNEALRKQREYNERQETIRKMKERSIVESGEPAKKRIKNHRCMCGVCGKEASFLCSGCQKAWYCSAKCQHTAWAEHCKECTESKRR